MSLSSSLYFAFLIAVFFLYWPLARFRALGLAVILLANYFFYAKWDLVYLFLIPAASTCDFLIGLGLGRAERSWVRRLLVGLSIAMNIGLMASLKYVPFLLDNYAALSGHKPPQWGWIFPLGLSFYCFQSLTYTIDLYRRDATPTRSLLAYLCAAGFFPTALAGPITRLSALLAQLESKDRWLAPEDGGRAAFLIGLGLTKKLLIADYLGSNLVNRVFDFPNLYTAAEVMVAVYAYALQLYYDFSGYTDIALGSALLLGIRLPENFRMPYAAENIADFWRRWHITLSNWLRDYLYFSLPKLRSQRKAFLYGNLVLTMAIGGLWHGPSWTFVVWGLLHGVALAAGRAWQIRRGRRPANPAWWLKLGRTFVTFHFVCLAWVFFRGSSLENALAVLGRLVSGTFSLANVSPQLVVVIGIAAAGHYLPQNWWIRMRDLYARAPAAAQAAALALLLVAIRYVSSSGAAPFIYTRF